jgi:hypothetical protein
MSLVTLALALRLMLGGVDASTAYRHASAAVEVGDATVQPELLLAIARVESRYDPTATSRLQNGKRITGSYRSTKLGRGMTGPFYCGPLQTYAYDWASCLAQRDLATGYRTGKAELDKWLKNPKVAGNIFRALLGHACGNHGLVEGRCNGYPNRVLWLAEKLGLPRRTPARS